MHIEKHGGRVILRPQESPKQTKITNEKLASHLVATKSGVITHFNIQNGERKISVNDTAYEGDVLVSGVIESGTDQCLWVQKVKSMLIIGWSVLLKFQQK